MCARKRQVLILSRRVRTRAFLSLVAVLLAACAKPTEVELRLVPCGEPVRVDLDVQGYDAEGEALAPLHASFAISDSGVFSDNYATVGLVKPDGMVTADFTLTWYGSDDVQEVVVLTGRTVPAAGEVLTLGAEGCAPVGDETTSDVPTGTSTGAPETVTGTSTGSSSTGDDTTTTGTSTTTGSATDGTTTTGTTEATDASSTGATTGDDTMLGDNCGGDPAFFCEGSGPGKIGQLLECQGTWQLGDCELTDCPALGFPQYKVVGCSGEEIFGCICQADPGTPCVPADQKCDPDGMTMTLCLDGVLSKTVCAKCYEDPNGPYCGE